MVMPVQRRRADDPKVGLSAEKRSGAGGPGYRGHDADLPCPADPSEDGKHKEVPPS